MRTRPEIDDEHGMAHRPNCEQPTPDQRVTRLSDGRQVRVDRCPTCGAVALLQLTDQNDKES